MTSKETNTSENISDMVFSTEFLSSDMDITDSGIDPFQSPPLFHLEPKREWISQTSASSSPPPPPPDHLFQSIPSPVRGLQPKVRTDLKGTGLAYVGRSSMGQPAVASTMHRHLENPVGYENYAAERSGVTQSQQMSSRAWSRPPHSGLDSMPAPVPPHAAPPHQRNATGKPNYPVSMTTHVSDKSIPAENYGYPQGSNSESSEWSMPQFWSMVDKPHTSTASAFEQHFGSTHSYGLTGGREDEWQKEQSDKRRLDRNSREQKRSKRISDQIKELKTLLEAAGVNMVKGNKSSILTSAAEYIMDLQQRNEAATRRAQEFASLASSDSAPSTAEERVAGNARGDRLVGGINYRRVFHDQSVPVALASVDGRFIDCNWRFERECGYSKDQLRGMTFFSLVMANGEHGNIFQIVAQMLKDTSHQPKQFVLRASLKSGDSDNANSGEEKLLQLSTIFADDPEDHEVKFFCCALLSVSPGKETMISPPNSNDVHPGESAFKSREAHEERA